MQLFPLVKAGLCEIVSYQRCYLSFLLSFIISQSPANYQFQYAVNEGSGGNDFGHEEERNGHQTRGQYRVLLPDGRLQVVSYTADKNGYRAEVTYQAGAGGAFKGYSAPAPQPKAHAPPPPPAEQGYGLPASSTGSESASSYNSNKRNTGSYVKLRRNINGRNFNYAF
jgi:hypothetical protein